MVPLLYNSYQKISNFYINSLEKIYTLVYNNCRNLKESKYAEKENRTGVDKLEEYT